MIIKGQIHTVLLIRQTKCAGVTAAQKSSIVEIHFTEGGNILILKTLQAL